MRRKKSIGRLITAFLAGMLFWAAPDKAQAAPAITKMPLADSMTTDYDAGFLSVTGYAGEQVHARTADLNTEKHRVVSTEYEFLKALDDARSGEVSIIEITEDLDLGYESLSEEAKACSSIAEYGWKMYAKITNPSIMMSGVSKLTIADTHGLTIFSRSGVTVRHAEWKLQGSSSDIVLRNLKLEGMWQWTANGDTKAAGWTTLKVNGVKGAWFDHCSFSIGYDGLADLENGASGITFSYCTFSLPTTEHPPKEDDLYKTVSYMEYLYQSGNISKDDRYYKMREAGVTKEQIMANEAFHQKAFMIGSGAKDFTDGEGLEDGNQRLQVTYAYNWIQNFGSRLPRLRQGVVHMYNCYMDNMAHFQLVQSVPAIRAYGAKTLNRAMAVYCGGTAAVDTCVYNGVDEPLIDSEQGTVEKDFRAMFQNAYNHTLILNSRITKTNGRTYTGSSWDNDGINEFTTKFQWTDGWTRNEKNWAWSSHIVGVENMKRGEVSKEPCAFTYDTTTKLPYAYKMVSLDEVTDLVETHAGAYTYSEKPEFWVRLTYEPDEDFEPVDSNRKVDVKELVINNPEIRIELDEVGQVMAEVKPSHASAKDLTYTSSNPEVAEVFGDSGLILPKSYGTAVITAQTADGRKAEATVTVYKKMEKLTLPQKSVHLSVGQKQQLEYIIRPEDATNQQIRWICSKPDVVTVDENGAICGVSEGSAVVFGVSEENEALKISCLIKCQRTKK